MDKKFKDMARNNRLWSEMARYLSGEMDEFEKASFMEEIGNDHISKSQFEMMKSTWKKFDDNPSLKYRDSSSAWNRLNERLERDGLTESSGKQVNTFFLRPVVRIAATVLLIVGLGIPALYYGINKDKDTPSALYHSSVEGVKTVDLPDGSRVYMNQGAEITFPDNFNTDRSVKLNGEAYFEVMSDPERPFRVQTGKIIVSVLGTSFNVKQVKNNPLIEVFVASGKVEVAGMNSKEILTLLPGEMGCSDGNEMKQGNMENLNYLSWKTKEFVFVDEPVADIFMILEEAYHIDIVAENLDIENMKLTSTYMQQSIDAILETIGAAFSLEIEKTGKTYYLN